MFKINAGIINANEEKNFFSVSCLPSSLFLIIELLRIDFIMILKNINGDASVKNRIKNKYKSRISSMSL